jgi:drug/metabolite transporter (DMT)-like permease
MTRPLLSAPFSSPDEAGRQRLIAIALMCSAVICFALLDTHAKWLGTHGMDPLLVSFARYSVSVLLVSLLINPWSHAGVLRARRPWLQLLRSLLLLASTVLNFFALRYLQLAETISIAFTTPLIVALVSGPLLGEWPGPRRLAAIGVGFLGVLLVTRPGIGGMHPAALLCVAGCVCYAFYVLTTRVLAASDSSETTMVYSGLAGTVALLPALPFVFSWPSSPYAWVALVAIGFFGALGHWLLIVAHRLAPATVLAPFIYSQLIWMVLLGWLVFDQLPDRWTFAGGAIVISSGLYLLYRERVRRVPADAVSARLD